MAINITHPGALRYDIVGINPSKHYCEERAIQASPANSWGDFYGDHVKQHMTTYTVKYVDLSLAEDKLERLLTDLNEIKMIKEFIMMSDPNLMYEFEKWKVWVALNK